MKALLTAMLLIFSVSLLAGPGRGAGKNKFKNMTPEQIFEHVSARKYMKLEDKLRLTKGEKAKLFPILKKYDKKVFALFKPRMEEMKKRMAERKARMEAKTPQKKNYDEKLQRMEKRMKMRAEMAQKMFQLQSSKIKELKAAGVPSELIVKTIKFERKMMRHFKGKRGHGKHGKWGKGKRGHRGDRF